MALRPKLRKSLGVKITTNAFYIRTLALAAKKYPRMLARLVGDNINIKDQINVGFAVSAPQGLVVPVVKNADKKNLAEIAAEEKTLTEKALDNRLTLEEIESETIALSNLGVYGIDSFIGIAPPPTSAILAIGNATNQLVPINGKPLVRKILSITLAVDHRVINGDYAAEFLGLITELLANPQKLL
jgi:pyruvate dehydrogenase E2 component (dihydrolipoamide acetyltransferase)